MRLLVIAPVTGEEDSGNVRVKKEPLGACCVVAAAKAAGHEAKVLHPIGQSLGDIRRAMTAYAPDAIGFSCMTYNFPQGLSLAQEVRSTLPNTKIIFGGVHPTGDIDAAAHAEVDVVVVGEGERTIVELLSHYETGQPRLSTIPGIRFRGDSGVVTASPRQQIGDLDELPFPDRSALPMTSYRSLTLHDPPGIQVGTMHTSRGCRFRCTFCSTPVSWPGRWRARSPERVVQEAEELFFRYGVRKVFFADEDFLADKQRVYGICALLRQRVPDLSWYCFARVTDVDKDLLCHMRAAGCITPFFGVESLNPRSLRRIRKGVGLDAIRSGLRLAHDVGFIVWGTYMIGYPWESEDELLRGLDQLLKLPIDYLYLSFVTPFPGTPLYAQCEAEDRLLTKDWTRYDANHPVIRGPVSPGRLECIHAAFTEEFYCGQQYLQRMWKRIDRFPRLECAYRTFLSQMANDGLVSRDPFADHVSSETRAL